MNKADFDQCDNYELTMSDSPLPRRTTASWCAVIAAVLLLLSLSVWALMTLDAGERPNVHRHPAGQLQADARTLVAAFSFLFESNADSSGPETPTTATPLCASNVAVQPLISASLCCTSNQSELLSELMTNVPARS